MQTLSVAGAKARLSALLTQVEAGEEVVITRRGVPIARIVAEPVAPNQPFDLAELFAFVDHQPLHSGPDAREFTTGLRAGERY
jgi:prevent-host-death family protein